MPVKPPDAGAAEDPLGQHAVGIGLLEASCVGALIARREPHLLVSLDRRCIHIAHALPCTGRPADHPGWTVAYQCRSPSQQRWMPSRSRSSQPAPKGSERDPKGPPTPTLTER